MAESEEFDTACAYRLHPSVALRPEPFGALAYHFGNRRLTLLKSRRLVEVLRALGSHGSARAALEAAGVPEASRATYERALASLLESEVIDAR
ncbi:MAG: mycofactocin biosynthesis chaperone MftB [Carbonactinosporaceae bacterium]